jgi:hypothetical protein
MLLESLNQGGFPLESLTLAEIALRRHYGNPIDLLKNA